MTDVLPTAETTAPLEPASRGRLSLRALGRRKAAVVGAIGLGTIVGCAVFAAWVAPADPGAQNLANMLAPPAWDAAGAMDNPLGTDALGRDVASRLVHGARNSLLISFAAMLIAAMLGL